MFLRCEEYSGKESLEVMWLLIVLNIQFFLIKKKNSILPSFVCFDLHLIHEILFKKPQQERVGADLLFQRSESFEGKLKNHQEI